MTTFFQKSLKTPPTCPRDAKKAHSQRGQVVGKNEITVPGVPTLVGFLAKKTHQRGIFGPKKCPQVPTPRVGNTLSHFRIFGSQNGFWLPSGCQNPKVAPKIPKWTLKTPIFTRIWQPL